MGFSRGLTRDRPLGHRRSELGPQPRHEAFAQRAEAELGFRLRATRSAVDLAEPANGAAKADD